MSKARSSFGTVRKLPSGAFQARHLSPTGERITAGTFDTEKAARAALAAIQTDLARGLWHDERAGDISVSEFAEQWLEIRRPSLAPRTVEVYESSLKRWILPAFARMKVRDVSILDIDTWWERTGSRTGAVNRRNAYFVLRNIFRFAVRYGLVLVNPCQIENAGRDVSAPRPHLSIEDFARIVDAMPNALHAAVWLSFGAHLRLGELCGLNRGDADLSAGTLTVTRQSQVVRGGTVLRDTKTRQQRTVAILEPALSMLRAHIEKNPALPHAPLFCGERGFRISRGTITREWNAARERVGLPTAHFHDVRHTSLTLTASFATPRENMARGGHSTMQAAMRYQHATEQRDSIVAGQASAALLSAVSKTFSEAN